MCLTEYFKLWLFKCHFLMSVMLWCLVSPLFLLSCWMWSLRRDASLGHRKPPDPSFLLVNMPKSPCSSVLFLWDWPYSTKMLSVVLKAGQHHARLLSTCTCPSSDWGENQAVGWLSEADAVWMQLRFSPLLKRALTNFRIGTNFCQIGCPLVCCLRRVRTPD